jgi:hypothetical protein
MDGLIKDGSYCQVCYGRLYTERDTLRRQVKQLTVERDQARAERDKARRERDAMKQGKLDL